MRISLVSSILFSITLLGSSSAESKGLRGLMGNPASQYCTDNGGTLSTHFDESGNEWSLCTFTNGSACEEWDYSRGDCQVGEYVSFTTYCRQNSGLYKAHRIDTVNVEGSPQEWYYTCQEQDGTICFEEDYYKGRCGAGGNSPSEPPMGNPASAYCTSNGGTEEMKYDESGNEWSLCTFTDGSACEEWDYSRGDCQVGEYVSFDTYCTQNSGLYKSHHIDTINVEGSPQELHYTCQEQDGTICFEEDYYKGEC